MSVLLAGVLLATQLGIVAALFLFAPSSTNPCAASAVAAACLAGCIVANIRLLPLLVQGREERLVRMRARSLGELAKADRGRSERLRAMSIEAHRDSLRIVASLDNTMRLLDAAAESAAGVDAGSVLAQGIDAIGRLVAAPTRLCEHRVVDAVVFSKVKLFHEQGIPCEVNLAVPAELDVSDVDLCSIFSNIADNALAACEDLASVEPEVDRFFRLSARVAGGYLVIRAQNSCCSSISAAPQKASGLVEHGWGLQILSLLAERYDGTFEFSRDGRVATILLSVRAGMSRADAR